MEIPDQKSEEAVRETRFAMKLSLVFGILMFLGKGAAYWLTGSSAIFSDATESVVHVAAVAFATFSLWLSTKPVDGQFTYGYERISFFSAGFEGGMICLAAIAIIWTAVDQWLTGITLEHLSYGTLVVLAAGLINAALGWYLMRTGKKNHSLILEANGKHVLTDCWTSFGVVGGLALVLLTGWKPLDPIFAIAVAFHILWSGVQLVLKSIGGLMDYSDPQVGQDLRARLDKFCHEIGVEYHGVRFRDTGSKLRVELHLLFPHEMPLGEAHRLATEIEEKLPPALGKPAEIVTHLESREDHGDVHNLRHYTGVPE